MKTLLITLDYYPATGGVAEYYGHMVKFWPGETKLDVLDNQNSQLMHPKLPLLKWLPSLLTIYKKLKSDQYDHVIIGQILPLGIAVVWLSKILKFKFTVVLHGMDIALAIKTPRKQRQTRKILLAANKIVANTEYTASLAKNFMEGEINGKVFIVNPGIDSTEIINFTTEEITEFKKKNGLENKFILLTIGRLVKRKGVDRIILALTSLNKLLPKLTYVILGGGPDEAYLRGLANSTSSNFAQHIIFTGVLTGRDKWLWLAACDAFIMTARDDDGDVESFGIVYLEAGLYKKPVIASNVGGVVEAVVDGVTGIMVDQKNTDEIAEAISYLFSNPEICKKLGEQGRARAMEKFEWSVLTNNFYNIINL